MPLPFPRGVIMSQPAKSPVERLRPPVPEGKPRNWWATRRRHNRSITIAEANELADEMLTRRQRASSMSLGDQVLDLEGCCQEAGRVIRALTRYQRPTDSVLFDD